jgi:hypothetical protein
MSTKQFPDEDKLQIYFDNTLPKKEKGKFFFGNQIAAPGLDPGETILFSYQKKLRYVAKAETGRRENKDRGEGYYSNFIVIKMPVRKVNVSLEEVERKLRAEAGLQKSLLHQGWTDIQDKRAEKVIEDMLFEDASTPSANDVPDGLPAKTPAHMKRHFTCYWTNATCKGHADYEGNPLEHTSGNRFVKSGVESDDSVYVVTVRKGLLYLIGRLTVARICSRAEAQEVLGTDDLWDAKDHIIAASATPMRFEFKVPIDITEKLLFIRKSGAVERPVFKKSGYLDQQTLRCVRKLSPESARLLDKLLPINKTVSNATKIVSTRKTSPTPSANDVPDGLPAKMKLTVYRFIRDTKTSRQIKEIYEKRCQVCGKRLEIQPGVSYAEAHHLQPLGGKHKGPDVHDNILCLCPNHHALFDYFAIPLDPAKLRLNKHKLRQSFVGYHNAHFHLRFGGDVGPNAL